MTTDYDWQVLLASTTDNGQLAIETNLTFIQRLATIGSTDYSIIHAPTGASCIDKSLIH